MSWFQGWHRLHYESDWEGWARFTEDKWTLVVFRRRDGEARPKPWSWAVHRTCPPSGPHAGGQLAESSGPVDARREAEESLVVLRKTLHLHAAEGQSL